MTDTLPFIVVGLVTGSLYGLAAMGLVLTYKTSGVLNFAHGAVATVAAYFFFELHVQRDIAWPIAALVCVLALGGAVGLVLERLARVLTTVSPAMQIVATVGLLTMIQGIAVAQWGADARVVPPFLPTTSVRLVGINVGADQLIIVAVALSLSVGLFVFFRSSRLGLAMQAVVDDPDLLATGGTSPIRVRRIAWGIGSAFACLSGIMLVPLVGLDATILTLLVVQAFGAAAVGGFRSLPLTYLGGLAVGVAAALSTKFIGDVRWLAGFPSAVPFLVLFVVLLVLPKHRLAIASRGPVRFRPSAAVAPRKRVVGLLVTAVLLLGLPEVVGTRLPIYTSALIYVAIFLSLHLLVRTSGQVSLAHASFAAVGAATFAHLLSVDLPWAVALLGAGVMTVPVGAVVAVPAIRLSGVYLAVATLGFGILMERLVYSTGLMFGGAGSRNTPRPDVWTLSSETGYYYVVLMVVALLAALGVAVTRNRLGRLLRAMSDSPVALMTHGTDVNLTRVLVFCISAFMAGIAGALFGGLTQSITGRGFNSFESLEWLVVLVIAGAVVRYQPVPTALVAAAVLVVVPTYLHGELLHEYLPVLFGFAAVTHALLGDRPEKHSRELRRPASSPVHPRSPVAARLEPIPLHVGAP